MKVFWLFGGLLLAGCNFDPRVQVYPITCELAGVTVVDGYAQRDGIVRQLYLEKETGENKKFTLIPGTECTRGALLRESEWEAIKDKWQRT